jgi:hypothetical protein
VGGSPAVADLRDRTPPRGLEPAAAYAGREARLRDLAAGPARAERQEVAGLHLDDIDWRAGVLLVHGMGGRHDVLPLRAGLSAQAGGWRPT